MNWICCSSHAPNSWKNDIDASPSNVLFECSRVHWWQYWFGSLGNNIKMLHIMKLSTDHCCLWVESVWCCWRSMTCYSTKQFPIYPRIKNGKNVITYKSEQANASMPSGKQMWWMEHSVHNFLSYRNWFWFNIAHRER